MSVVIYNLTQHSPTPSQIAEGVGEPLEGCKALLTFETLPSTGDITQRAFELVRLVAAAAPAGSRVMVGGAPYLMGTLVRFLQETGYRPVYSFTQRKTVEAVQPDGTVKKTAVFEHVGWVEET